MPSVLADGPLSAYSNSANSSFDGHARKSHDRTLGRVFTYTNGTDVETGLADHRLDQVKSLKSNSLHSLPNGTPNGSITSTRERSHSKAGSSNSISSGTPRQYEAGAKGGSSDGLTRLSLVERMTGDHVNGSACDAPKPPDLGSLRTNSRHGSYTHQDPHALQKPSTTMESATSGRAHGLTTSPTHLPPLNRFSSPPGMSSSTAPQDHRPGSSSELPKLTHRHTLQIPKASAHRTSRDFSFSAGPSEEAISTGRFSPTHGDTPRHRRASLGLMRKATRSMHSDAHQDEVLPDEDAERWTEAIRQKRASRRRRKDDEDDDRVIVGKKVEEGHVNWVIAYNMLTGIRFTVSRTNAKVDRELTDVDFTARHKFSFDITGNELTPSAKYDFKFKDYSPWVFRHLRAIFGLDPADYLMSLTSKYILSELGSPGKSGSFFYFSRDYKYIIKTIHHAEHKVLRKVLRDYYRHVVDNPNTLISQFYGLHRVKIPYGRKIHFVVMNNLFPPHRDIHQMFDLKGSTIGREYREEDLASNPRATLKDLNWRRRELHLEFDPPIKEIFVAQMRRDVALLQRLHIMDYSLLVGMHDLSKGNEENVREQTLQVYQPGGERPTGDSDMHNMLTRTPSRLESAAKARQLRLTLKKEKPVPMGLVAAKMPEEMEVDDERRDRIFYGDDGGIRARHEDGRKGEEIYYLGIIDCLTHYGLIKRIEHYWKGLSHDRTQISPVAPGAYGDRFANFIMGITMTKEEADRKAASESGSRPQTRTVSEDPNHGRPAQAAPIMTLDGATRITTDRSNRDLAPTSSPISPVSAVSPTLSPTPVGVDRGVKKAPKQVDKASNPEKARRRSDEDLPDRTLGPAEGRGQSTLPVVEEVGENGGSNNASKSNVDYAGKSNGGTRQVSRSTAGDGERLGEEADGKGVDDERVDEEENEVGYENGDVQRTPYSRPRSVNREKSIVDIDGFAVMSENLPPGPGLGTGMDMQTR